MNSETPPGRNEGSSSTVIAVIVVAVIMLCTLSLLGVLFVRWTTIPVVEKKDGVEEGQVAVEPDDESPLEKEPSEASPDGSAGAVEVIEQPAPPEPDAVTPPVEPPMPPESDAARPPSEEPMTSEPDAVEVPAEKPAAPKSDAATTPVEKPEPPESTDPKAPIEKPEPPMAPKVAEAKPPGPDSPAVKDDAADEKNLLSALPPYETVGVKTGDGPVRRSVVFSGEEHQYGIWAQPNEDRGTAQVSYLLKGQYMGLRGKAGICDVPDDVAIRDGASPSGVLRIYGDGNLLWESDSLAGFGAVEQFEIEVKGIELLALAVESSSPVASSRFAWGNLHLTTDEE